MRALTVTGLGLDFPHVVQAAKIVRRWTCMKTGKLTRETIYTRTDRPSPTASRQLIARIARSQWEIEAVHRVSDTVFAEDASKIRTSHGPAGMAPCATSPSRPADHRQH
ncbi:hypothetical protein ACFWRV_11250 [Streptomyces sp. NPDC058576]|uniref:hypothetical protein n=1 Tax=Streptomyces sp. NPDC058576 TaxID=3346547 RepID=UPI00365C4351